MNLTKAEIQTPLGPMLAIGDEHALYFLEFTDQKGTEQKLKKLQKMATITEGESATTRSIRKELELYFKGALHEFKTQIVLRGTPFQVRVWQELQRIPYGETRSYAELAAAIGRPTAFRAVARANSTNVLPPIVPCHRVINTGGGLGGYAGGLDRKKALLALEHSAA